MRFKVLVIVALIIAVVLISVGAFLFRAEPKEPTGKLQHDTNLNIPSFGLDEANELYICSFDGKIYTLQII